MNKKTNSRRKKKHVSIPGVDRPINDVERAEAQQSLEEHRSEMSSEQIKAVESLLSTGVLDTSQLADTVKTIEDDNGLSNTLSDAMNATPTHLQ